MNKMTKLAAAIALTTGALVATPAMAEAEYSATAGFVTDYYFRGANLGDAGAYGSLDAAMGGFYAGVWAIDDGNGASDGVEYDLYGGYAFEFENGLSLDLGLVQYEYTYTDDSETDISLTAGFGAFSVNYSDISDDNPDAKDFDASAISISWSGEVFGATYGRYESDDQAVGTANSEQEYDWIEVSASGEVAGLDVSMVIGTTENVESNGSSDAGSDGYIFLDVSKSFDL
jgi:uncharacterized protein (TIGR02001 family)